MPGNEYKECNDMTRMTKEKFIQELLAAPERKIFRGSTTRCFKKADQTVQGYIWSSVSLSRGRVDYVNEYQHGRPCRTIKTYESDSTGWVFRGVEIENSAGERLSEDELSALVEELRPDLKDLDTTCIVSAHI